MGVQKTQHPNLFILLFSFLILTWAADLRLLIVAQGWGGCVSVGRVALPLGGHALAEAADAGVQACVVIQ